MVTPGCAAPVTTGPGTHWQPEARRLAGADSPEPPLGLPVRWLTGSLSSESETTSSLI